MDKRALKQQYKESPKPSGVYRVLNVAKGRSLVGSSVNVAAILNRHRAELRMGGHRNLTLQRDWNEVGDEGFTFEVLDALEPRNEPGYDLASELKALEELWLERLSPYGDDGYNDRPK